MKCLIYAFCLLPLAVRASFQCESRISRDVRNYLSEQVRVVSPWVWEALLPPTWTPERVANAIRRMPPLPYESHRSESVQALRFRVLNEVASRWDVAGNVAELFFSRRYADYFKCYAGNGDAYFLHPAAGVIYVTTREQLSRLRAEDILRQTWESSGRYSANHVRGHIVMQLRKKQVSDVQQKPELVPEPIRDSASVPAVDVLKLWPDGGAILNRCGMTAQRVQCWGRGSVLSGAPEGAPLQED